MNPVMFLQAVNDKYFKRLAMNFLQKLILATTVRRWWKDTLKKAKLFFNFEPLRLCENQYLSQRS
jgi:hypothetical protein